MFFTFELSTFPLSLFNEERMRKGTNSSLILAFTPTELDAVQAVVLDGYPSDVNGKNTKSAKRIRRANLHSSHEIIFNKATCPEISQEQFLANDRNKYDNIFVVGKDIDFLVLLTWLAPIKEILYFRKCGKGRTPDVLYSTTSFKYKFSRMILFIQAFSGCGYYKCTIRPWENKILLSFRKKNRRLKEKMQVFFKSEATIDQVAKAGETFMIHLYGGIPRISACDLNHLRYMLFTQSATKARSTLARLPPTVDAARFHALRSYLQIQKWLRHEKNPLEWGWVPTRFGLSPRKMERDAAPEYLLKIISCICKKGCKNACGYRKAGLICSSLCTCFLGEACENVSDINLLQDSIEDEDDTPSSINNFIYEDMEDLNLQLDEENKEQQTELEDFRPGPSKRQKL
ncbi:hypothetical protein AVEN_238520-1 [Araneus ventricosus]|uniref:Tesmin/TSO1-like CXC domain-containing protein n=1 Tax=Araneus ventricosus TaxID=182803 RepID=A0A4Y2RYW3_ARAVE|nr:hypothetical protein AVEN_238520-1 [Araneus ventricosus]